MNEQADPKLERFEQLLVDRATVGLIESELKELERLAIEVGLPIDDSVDLAVAAVDSLVATEELEPLPEHLEQAVVASARAATATFGDSQQSSQASTANYDSASNTGGMTRREMFSIFAVAASLILAAFVWFSRPQVESKLSVAQLRDQLMQTKPLDLVQVSWEPTAKDANETISGIVIWSSSQQEGYMTFKGLPENNPTVEQYQLWIFDKDRDEKYPVDGGVFDIPNADSETIVAIDSKIKIAEATLFAITIERPGGVVVSDRRRLPLLAKVAPQR